MPQQARAIASATCASTSPIRRRATWRRWSLFSIVLVVTLGDRPLARMAACWSPSARTRSARGCSATTPSPTSSPRWSSPASSAPPRAPPMCCCSAMSARPSPRCSIRSCRCSGCCSAARRPRSGRSLGTLFMYYVVDITSGYTSAYMLIVGVALILLVLFFPERHARHDPRPLAEVAAMTPLLDHARALAAIYGGLQAVDGVDFALMPGEIRAIIGPNGAGKTTFVSLVCGRVEPIVRHDRLRRRRHHRPAGAPARAAAASPTPSRSPASSPI